MSTTVKAAVHSLAVGLIDSGVGPGTDTAVHAARGFFIGADGEVVVGAPAQDRLGHGSALAAILAAGDPGIRLWSAQVFTERLSCSARQVAAALDWLVAQRVRLVNMSFGLTRDRDTLRLACTRALAAGVILVAASPARGAPVFPAAYPGVIRATGDARCGVGEISCLATAQADFGAHVRSQGGTVAGASVGCARVSAFAAAFLAQHPRSSGDELRAWLRDRAAYHGPEHRIR